MKLILKILMIISIVIIYKPEELVNSILVLLDDLQNVTDIEPEKLNDQYIGEDLKASPQKEVDINLNTLANQTKYSTAIKCLLNNI